MDEATKLLEAVNRLGMAGCNVCPYLRSIDEIGGSWQAAMSLIAAHKLFYTKVYRHRTVYLSAEVYALLRCIRQGREPLYPYPARHLLDLLEQREPCTMQELKATSGLAAKTFQKAWQTLLETMAVTAWAPYQELNPQWSFDAVLHRCPVGGSRRPARMGRPARRSQNPPPRPPARDNLGKGCGKTDSGCGKGLTAIP